jgi:hypothetical protein
MSNVMSYGASRGLYERVSGYGPWHGMAVCVLLLLLFVAFPLQSACIQLGGFSKLQFGCLLPSFLPTYLHYTTYLYGLPVA